MIITPDLVETHLNKYPLLAKWREDDEDFRPARGFTWAKHTREVLWGLNLLFTEPFFGGRWYDSFAHALHDKMGRTFSFDDLQRWSLLSALAHDLGKCSGEFQHMLVGMELEYLAQKGPFRGYEDPAEAVALQQHMAGIRRHRQLYRHEFLSALLMFHHPEIRQWFRGVAGSDEGLAYVLSGAFGHHIKGSDHKAFNQDPDLFLRRGFGDLPVYTDKVADDMNLVVAEFMPSWSPALPSFPTLARLPAGNPIVKSNKLKERLTDMRESPLFRGPGNRDLDDDKISSAIKWIVILADTFGSIGTVQNEGLDASQVRDRIHSSVKVLWGKVQVDYEGRIRRRFDRMGKPVLGSLWGKDSPLHSWQKNCRSKHKSLLLTSSTGGGKTLGTFCWASGSPEHPLIYCTPTTDTATCLHEDYADKDDWLRHSKAWYDLKYRPTHEENIGTPGEPTPDEEEQDEGHEMLDLFRGCDRDVMFTTVDQVVGLTAFYRKSVALLPSILKDQIAFDEVSSYDSSMLAFHDRFLTIFPGIRTAHLSATFPKDLETRIANKIHQPNPLSPSNTAPRIVRDSRRNGKPRMIKRFRIHVLSDVEEAATKFLPGTLWFTNVVARAQGMAERFPDAACYHSRFSYEDRQQIRDKLVQEFHKPHPAIRVVATQAAEMSFDISALGLISEIGPIAALIQRLGRVNRQGEYGIIDVYFYIPVQPNGLPYVASRTEAVVIAAYNGWRDWLLQFKDREVSQDDLEQAFQAFYAKPENRSRSREVFSPRLQTYRHSVRHAIYTTPCLLHTDVQPYLINKQTMPPAEILRKSIPVALSPEEKRTLFANKSLHQRVYVIDDTYGTYDPRLGFLRKSGGNS